MAGNAYRVTSSSSIGAMSIITTDSGDRTQTVGQVSHPNGSSGPSARASLMVCQPAHTLAERQVLCDGFGVSASLLDADVEDVAAPRRRMVSDEEHAHRGETPRIVRSRPASPVGGICSGPEICSELGICSGSGICSGPHAAMCFLPANRLQRDPAVRHQRGETVGEPDQHRPAYARVAGHRLRPQATVRRGHA
jgi:hypothetical protein